MAIVYSYPGATPTLSDTVLGTQFDYDGNPTKSFLISDIIGLVPTPPTPPIPTLQEVCDAGSQALNVPILIEDLNTPNVLQVFSEDGVAIFGQSAEGVGVQGNTDGGSAVYGTAQTGYGGYFISDTGNGVYGYSGDSNGVFGSSDAGYGGFFSSAFTYSIIAAQSAAKPGGGSWDAYSDSRVKEDVKPYMKGLTEILLVNPVNYKYNGLANTIKDIEYTGVIAQEIKDVFPETVNTYKEKLNEEDEEKTELYSFNSTALTFALINAVKELKAEIELLKTK